MAQQTFTIAASADDDHAMVTGSTVYPVSGSAIHQTARVVATTERSKWSPTNYEVSNALFRWDTSALPDNATITAATFRAVIDTKSDSDGLSISAGWSSWDGSASDFSATPLTSAHAGTSISSFPAAGTSFDLQLINFDNVSSTGTTYLKLFCSQLASDAAPTGGNYIDIHTFDNTGAFTPPQIIVTYVVPQAGYIQLGADGPGKKKRTQTILI